MKKKRNIIILIMVLVLLCGWAIGSIHNNYQHGRELDYVLERLSWQCTDLAESIDRLKSELDKGNNDYSFLNTYYNAMLMFYSWFGYEDMPFLEDVREEWTAQFANLRQQALRGDEHVRNIFTDDEKFKEVAHLRDQLYKMVDAVDDFRERYEQMSEWERYFVSWKDEQKILNEKVRFSPLPQ